MSGHSKWNNIKRKKEATDGAKAKIFTKIGREIAVCVKEGGGDVNNNSKLRDLVAKAKSNNVPNDNIERIIKKAMGDRVKDVVLSKRLSDSPSCIVVDENDSGIQMECMMRAMGQAGPGIKPILEINGDHAIVKTLESCSDESYIADVSEVLFDQALLVSGAELKDPMEFVKAVNKLLSK
jgi:HSP90 family molecular chaperone